MLCNRGLVVVQMQPTELQERCSTSYSSRIVRFLKLTPLSPRSMNLCLCGLAQLLLSRAHGFPRFLRA